MMRTYLMNDLLHKPYSSTDNIPFTVPYVYVSILARSAAINSPRIARIGARLNDVGLINVAHAMSGCFALLEVLFVDGMRDGKSTTYLNRDKSRDGRAVVMFTRCRRDVGMCVC